MAMSYYAAGNTAAGRVNVLASNVEQCEKIVVLKHPSAEVKTKIIRYWIDEWEKEGNHIEILESVDGKQFLDGVIDPKEKRAIVSNTICTDEINNTHIIDLSSYILETASRHQHTMDLQLQMEKGLNEATQFFAKGLEIHDELEGIYIRHMDFLKADAVADHWLMTYLPGAMNGHKQGQIKQRLFGTNTADGAINCIPDLVRPFTSVHHVKGRAGTGKSYFMNRIKEVAVSAGLSVEQYVCSFDPKSNDMIIIRDLDLCIFDSTAPHAFSPMKTDLVVDLYEQTVTPGVDEHYKKEIAATTRSYQTYLRKGIAKLNKVNNAQGRIDRLYRDDFTDEVMRSIRNTIKQHAKKVS